MRITLRFLTDSTRFIFTLLICIGGRYVIKVFGCPIIKTADFLGFRFSPFADAHKYILCKSRFIKRIKCTAANRLHTYASDNVLHSMEDH